VLATARERQQRSDFFFFIAEAYRQRVVPMARVLVLLTKSRKFWTPGPRFACACVCAHARIGATHSTIYDACEKSQS